MAGVREKLLTASDLAALCEVDLKTIHNWVDRGKIPHFRTPGRHLRFRAADVAEFLRAWGYSVPRELAKATSRTMIVVGPAEVLAHVTRALGEGVPLRHAAHAYDALIYAGAEPADVFMAEARSLSSEVDATSFFEAVHRASPQAILVVLAEERGDLPEFVTVIGRNDAQALKELVAPEQPTPAPEEAQRAAGGAGR